MVLTYPTEEFCELAVFSNICVNLVLVDSAGMDIEDASRRYLANMLVEQPDAKQHSQLSLETVRCYHTCAKSFLELLASVNQGLLGGVEPQLCQDCVSGTYFMKNAEGRMIAVFKPRDEEPAALNNPKDAVAQSSLPGDIPTGQGCLREYAAFLLDCGGVAGVPQTGLVEIFPADVEIKGPSSPSREVISQTKYGSLQEYVPHTCCSEDIGFGKFPVSQVQRIAALDIRLLNTDRHGGNILVADDGETVNLIPIDHAMCLPESLPEQMWFEWLNWPQSKSTLSEELKSYVKTLDADNDCASLRELGIGPKGRKSLRIGTALLQLAVELNLRLSTVGHFICSVSGLPKLVAEHSLYGDSADDDSIPSSFFAALKNAVTTFEE